MGNKIVPCEICKNNGSNVKVEYKVLFETDCRIILSDMNELERARRILQSNVRIGYKYWEERYDENCVFFGLICKNCYANMKEVIHLATTEGFELKIKMCSPGKYYRTSHLP